jgi:hypothetical protein
MKLMVTFFWGAELGFVLQFAVVFRLKLVYILLDLSFWYH